jgi:hypothetical protein
MTLQLRWMDGELSLQQHGTAEVREESGHLTRQRSRSDRPSLGAEPTQVAHVGEIKATAAEQAVM